MKNLDELKVLRKKHYDRYSQSTQVGKLRAWGRLKKLATKQNSDKPVYRGWCQATGTADVFTITIWDNDNNYRFEICEDSGYAHTGCPAF